MRFMIAQATPSQMHGSAVGGVSGRIHLLSSFLVRFLPG